MRALVHSETTSSELRGYLYVFIAGAGWGTIGPLIKVLESLGATNETTSFLRLVLAFGITLLLAIATGGLRSLRVDRRTLLYCALLGILCNGACNILYVYAVTTIGVTFGAVLMNLAPVFTAILSALVFSERFTLIKGFCILCVIMGCSLAVTGGDFAGAPLAPLGVLMGIGAGFCYGVTPILARYAGAYTSSLTVNTYSLFFAALFVLPFLRPWEGGIYLTPEIMGAGLIYALVPTVGSYLLYFHGIRKITDTSMVPVIASVETVVAAVLGCLFFGDILGPLNILGIVLVFIAIAISSVKRRRASTE